MNKTSIVIGVFTILVVMLISSPAGATPLVNNTAVVPSAFAGSPGTLLASVTRPFTSALGASDFSGSVSESVYRDAVTGNIDFVYQFNSAAGSGQPIEQMSDSAFDAFSTDVQVDTTVAFGGFTAGGAAPA